MDRLTAEQFRLLRTLLEVTRRDWRQSDAAAGRQCIEDRFAWPTSARFVLLARPPAASIGAAKR